jgi:hypothetical protein
LLRPECHAQSRLILHIADIAEPIYRKSYQADISALCYQSWLAAGLWKGFKRKESENVHGS